MRYFHESIKLFWSLRKKSLNAVFNAEKNYRDWYNKYQFTVII